MDRFVFAAATDSAVGTLRDTIYNFVSGRDDIDLARIDANTGLTGNQAFSFAASAAAHAVWAVASGANLILRLDRSGDALADMELTLAALTSLQAGDVIL